MANEIKMSASLAISTTNFTEQFSPGTINADLASQVGAGGVQAIATSDTEVVNGSTTDGGVYYVRNLDETNYVEVGSKFGTGTAYYFLKLLPGEFSIGRLSESDIWAKANTATVNLQFRLLSP